MSNPDDGLGAALGFVSRDTPEPIPARRWTWKRRNHPDRLVGQTVQFFDGERHLAGVITEAVEGNLVRLSVFGPTGAGPVRNKADDEPTEVPYRSRPLPGFISWRWP